MADAYDSARIETTIVEGHVFTPARVLDAALEAAEMGAWRYTFDDRSRGGTGAMVAGGGRASSRWSIRASRASSRPRPRR